MIKYEIFIKNMGHTYSIPVFTKEKINLKDLNEAAELAKIGKNKLKRLHKFPVDARLEVVGIKMIPEKRDSKA